MSKAAAEGVAWTEWGPEPFARAAKEGKPVLLFVIDPRSTLNEQIEKTISAGSVGDLVVNRFVPVRVSNQERPDIQGCYNSVFWMSLLSSDARKMPDLWSESKTWAGPDVKGGLSSAQALPFAPLEWQELLLKAAASYHPSTASKHEDDGKPVWTGAVGEFKARELRPDGPQRSLKALKAKSKIRPDPSEELFVYAAHEWKDDEARALAILGASQSFRGAETLRILGLGGCAAYADRCWKANSLSIAKGEPFKKAGAEAVDLLVAELFDQKTRVFKASSTGEAPVFLADGNAQAVLALLKAWAHLGKKQYFDIAENVLQHLEKKMYDPVLGMVHCQLPGRPVVHGLLADNAWTALAFTEAYLMTGRKPYREFADQLGRFLFQELWERERGGFLTRTVKKEDFGPLTEPRLDAKENAVAFEAVWRLSEIKGSHNYRKWVDWGLKSPALPDGDPGLARIQDMLAKGRMDLEVVGVLSDPKTEALLAAVNRLYLPRKIVSFVDPNDQDYVMAHKLEAVSYPRLFACGANLKRIADTDDPDKVPEIVAALRA